MKLDSQFGRLIEVEVLHFAPDPTSWLYSFADRPLSQAPGRSFKGTAKHSTFFLSAIWHG